ncbi:hypothetical protein KBI23_26095 [bacterium]|nr:hypothetical protein [bacterium]MBP9807158.1 hypothetical protein [bacterium]
MLTIAKAPFKSFPDLDDVANQPFVMGNEPFLGPYKSSLEVDDAPGLIAIFKADSLQLLNLYQTVSVRASAMLEIGAAPANTTVVFAVHYTEGMAAHSRSRLASTILAELSI